MSYNQQPPWQNQQQGHNYLNPQFAPPPQQPGQKKHGLLGTINSIVSNVATQAQAAAAGRPPHSTPPNPAYNATSPPPQTYSSAPWSSQPQPPPQPQQPYAQPTPPLNYQPPAQAPPVTYGPGAAAPPPYNQPSPAPQNYSYTQATSPGPSAPHAPPAVNQNQYPDWSGLIDYASSPARATPKLKGFLRGVAKYLMSTSTGVEVPSSSILTPSKLANFYSPLPDYQRFFAAASHHPKRLSSFFSDLQIEYVLIPSKKGSSLPPSPVLTVEGFERLLELHILLRPDEATQLLTHLLSLPGTSPKIKDPENGKTFPPGSLPRRALPSIADSSTAHLHSSSWNRVISDPTPSGEEEDDLHALRKQFSSLQTSSTTQSHTISSLESKISSLRSAHETEIKNFQDLIQRQTTDLQSERSESAQKSQELDAARQKLRELELDSAASKRKNAELASLQSRFATTEQQLTTQRQQLTKEIDDLSTKLRNADDELFRLRSTVGELDELKAAMRTKNSEIDRIRREAAQRELEAVEELREQIRRKDSEIAGLKHRLKVEAALPSSTEPVRSPTLSSSPERLPSGGGAGPAGGYMKRQYEPHRGRSGTGVGNFDGPGRTPSPMLAGSQSMANIGQAAGFNGRPKVEVGPDGRPRIKSPVQKTMLPYPEDP